jgi:threonine/homoserine efflux transporter RhtA
VSSKRVLAIVGLAVLGLWLLFMSIEALNCVDELPVASAPLRAAFCADERAMGQSLLVLAVLALAGAAALALSAKKEG